MTYHLRFHIARLSLQHSGQTYELEIKQQFLLLLLTIPHTQNQGQSQYQTLIPSLLNLAGRGMFGSHEPRCASYHETPIVDKTN
jgi:hypothetical protein